MNTIINKIKDLGYVTYNPYNNSLERPRYIVPLNEFDTEEIDKIAVELYLDSLEVTKKELVDEYGIVKNFKQNLFFDIIADESFYEWTCDLAYDCLEDALEVAKQLNIDEIWDAEDGSSIYVNETN
jgi:hypothetical protein